MPRTPHHRQSGFTLVELLVALAVLAITLAIAVPGYQSIVASSRLSAYSGDLLASLQLARSEAIKRNSRVTVCRSADSESCGGAGGWGAGWLVFVDAANPGVVDGGEAVLHAHPAARGLALESDAAVEDMVSFLSSGRARTGTGAVQSGDIAVCDTGGSGVPSRVVTIEPGTGRPSVANAGPCA